MTATEQDRRAVLGRLRWYRDRIKDLVGIVAEESPLQDTDRALAQKHLRELQAALADDTTAMTRALAEGTINQYEFSYLAPAVREAKSRIHFECDSSPSSNWYIELSIVRIDFDQLLIQLGH